MNNIHNMKLHFLAMLATVLFMAGCTLVQETDSRNIVKRTLDEYVLSDRISGVVSILSDTDCRFPFRAPRAQSRATTTSSAGVATTSIARDRRRIRSATDAHIRRLTSHVPSSTATA